MGRAKGKPQRTISQVVRHRKIIAGLYLQGWLQCDIADHLKIARSTVTTDLKAIHQEWLASSLRDFDEAKARELARIDTIEMEYWEAWEKSKKEKKTTTSGKETTDEGLERKKASVRLEETPGDPRYLQGIQWCIDKRCKILGLDAPLKVANTDVKGNDLDEIRDTYKDTVPDERLDQIADAL
jgi:hypothetical protein